MIACEQETVEDKEEEVNKDEAKAKELEANRNSSLMVGLDSPKTIKFIGVIGGKQVLILLNSGATHNFILDRVVDKL